MSTAGRDGILLIIISVLTYILLWIYIIVGEICLYILIIIVIRINGIS